MKHTQHLENPPSIRQAPKPRSLTSRLRAFLPVIISCLFLTLAGLGCNSFSGGDTSGFASVTIKNHSVQEIAATAAEVFGADGYTGGMSGSEQMVFQKAASRGTTVAREGLVATGYGAQTITRVRISIVQLPANSYRLDCKAFVVSGGDDPFFQNEVALANIRSGPYQSLLEKVKKQLK